MMVVFPVPVLAVYVPAVANVTFLVLTSLSRVKLEAEAAGVIVIFAFPVVLVYVKVTESPGFKVEAVGVNVLELLTLTT